MLDIMVNVALRLVVRLDYTYFSFYFLEADLFVLKGNFESKNQWIITEIVNPEQSSKFVTKHKL